MGFVEALDVGAGVTQARSSVVNLSSFAESRDLIAFTSTQLEKRPVAR